MIAVMFMHVCVCVSVLIFYIHLQTECDKVYYRGDAMRAATSFATRPAFGGFLPLPVAGSDGSCIESNYAHFMEPIRDNQCLRYVSNLKESCDNELSLERFANLRFFFA
jgi:hypothetical protein